MKKLFYIILLVVIAAGIGLCFLPNFFTKYSLADYTSLSSPGQETLKTFLGGKGNFSGTANVTVKHGDYSVSALVHTDGDNMTVNCNGACIYIFDGAYYIGDTKGGSAVPVAVPVLSEYTVKYTDMLRDTYYDNIAVFGKTDNGFNVSMEFTSGVTCDIISKLRLALSSDTALHSDLASFLTVYNGQTMREDEVYRFIKYTDLTSAAEEHPLTVTATAEGGRIIAQSVSFGGYEISAEFNYDSEIKVVKPDVYDMSDSNDVASVTLIANDENSNGLLKRIISEYMVSLQEQKSEAEEKDFYIDPQTGRYCSYDEARDQYYYYDTDIMEFVYIPKATETEKTK